MTPASVCEHGRNIALDVSALSKKDGHDRDTPYARCDRLIDGVCQIRHHEFKKCETRITLRILRDDRFTQAFQRPRPFGISSTVCKKNQGWLMHASLPPSCDCIIEGEESEAPSAVVLAADTAAAEDDNNLRTAAAANKPMLAVTQTLEP